ncbi:hypothetical protein BST81_24315 [Leptolyngbya sp. 'hensonii']|uniref:hypothetical protein n=1 Tax=Leptolyngbya sp. 'hensonii' TaxID=1922337 RepID=UPI00094FB0FB|nr:hypothetical protein [Leptolyngbya sp. 'hensonii']OLP15845.1 hypothetical protein BST81_24315 [Leptolyngbya sp. 'hensonii']
MSQRNEGVEIGLGLLLALGLAFFFSLVLAFLPPFNRDYRFLALWFSVGIWQWIYVLPIVLWLQQGRNWGLMKGMLIGATMITFLTGPCFVVGLMNVLRR